MPKESLILTPPIAAGPRAVKAIEIDARVIAYERVVRLNLEHVGVVNLRAEDAHRVAVALYGLSEDHAQPVEKPDLSTLKGGDLVIVHEMRAGEIFLTAGRYANQRWRVCKLKKEAKPDHIWVRRGPNSYYYPEQKHISLITV